MQDRRSENRLLCADMIEVTWRDGNGRARRATGVLEDISRCGACVQLETPIETGAEVSLNCAQGPLAGVVRYCVYQEIGYFAGIQFGEETRWSRQQFEPQHLLDLEQLLETSRKSEKQ
jgi:hypothetical protein